MPQCYKKIPKAADSTAGGDLATLCIFKFGSDDWGYVGPAFAVVPCSVCSQFKPPVLVRQRFRMRSMHPNIPGGHIGVFQNCGPLSGAFITRISVAWGRYSKGTAISLEISKSLLQSEAGVTRLKIQVSGFRVQCLGFMV